MTKFETAQTEVFNYLQLSTSKVSLTIDMWTFISALGILAIIVLYIILMIIGNLSTLF